MKKFIVITRAGGASELNQRYIVTGDQITVISGIVFIYKGDETVAVIPNHALVVEEQSLGTYYKEQ